MIICHSKHESTSENMSDFYCYYLFIVIVIYYNQGLLLEVPDYHMLSHVSNWV